MEELIPELELGPAVFTWCVDRNNRGRGCLVLSWIHESQYANLFQHRLVVFHLGPPWFRTICGIRNTDEKEEAKK
ncbi:hypothetical protein LCGC14_1111780 [marine sediment metagenome]|uniref:Uncharacterized protein n=1 Tax=marine sediment metagenome TaxID=412755 RepID=A0A0F9MUE4_9ZZZZ